MVYYEETVADNKPHLHKIVETALTANSNVHISYKFDNKTYKTTVIAVYFAGSLPKENIN